MNISQDNLRRAAEKSGIAIEQADLLWHTLESDPTRTEKPKFDVANVAYYLGALIVIGAMGWFMNLGWESLGGGGLLAIASGYAACFVLGGRTLWRQGQRTPGGLLITMAVCMSPLAVYGLERVGGFWPAGDPGSYRNFHPYINGSWIFMELATVMAGVLALRFWRFPFLTAPIAYALWFMSMDLIELVGRHEGLGWREKQIITAVFGGIMLVGAYFVDLRGQGDDYAFWLYLFGLAAFWGGLSFIDSHSEWGRLAYCLINLGLIFCALALRRRVFMVFGSLGLFGYLSYLAYHVFADSLLFPFVLTLLGIGIIYLGVQYQRRRKKLEHAFATLVLPHIRGLIPPRALMD